MAGLRTGQPGSGVPALLRPEHRALRNRFGEKLPRERSFVDLARPRKDHYRELGPGRCKAML